MVHRFRALALVAGLGAASVLLPGAAKAYPPIPAPYAEIVPTPVGPGYAWQPGHWQWTGYRYAWVGGHYVPRLAAYHRWVPPHWGPRGFWVAGHWA